MKVWWNTFNHSKTTLLPLAFGYVASGITYGILMRSHGFSILTVALMSASVYAGSLQFAAIPIYLGNFDPISTLVFSFFVNFRHIFYGISMLGAYKGTGLAKPFLIYTLSDEVFSINFTLDHKDPVERKRVYLVNALFLYGTWIIMTSFGALLGSGFTFETKGIDFAMTALFICITGGLWKEEQNHFSILVGILISLVCLLIFGKDYFLIPSLILIVLVFYIIWRKKDDSI